MSPTVIFIRPKHLGVESEWLHKVRTWQRIFFNGMAPNPFPNFNLLFTSSSCLSPHNPALVFKDTPPFTALAGGGLYAISNHSPQTLRSNNSLLTPLLFHERVEEISTTICSEPDSQPFRLPALATDPRSRLLKDMQKTDQLPKDHLVVWSRAFSSLT